MDDFVVNVAGNQQVQVRLNGDIFVDHATMIREKMIPYTDQGYKDFIFDFHNVSYIDSSGLGVLVAVQKRAKINGGKVVIKGLNGQVKELFELTRLTRVFQIDQ